MPIRDALQPLLDQDWALVPIPPRSKAPDIKGWQDRVFTIDDFSEGGNVGVKLGDHSRGLVDIDCDSMFAAQACLKLLPKTKTHGRASRPASHYFYRIDTGKAPPSTVVHRDLRGAGILELRSTGGQTVIPPSVHPSGELLSWTDDTPVLVIAQSELDKAIESAVVTAMCAAVWPAAHRHDFAGRLAGFLVRYLKDIEVIPRIVDCAAELAGDEEAHDRARYARETVDKHKNGGLTTGAPKLKELMGDEGPAFCRAILKLTGAGEGLDQLEALNDRHFVVQLGSSMVVGTEPSRLGDAVEFQKFEEFEKRYYNQFLGKKKLGRAWLEYADRRTYERTVFAPPGSGVVVDPSDYNLWRGFSCEPLDPAIAPEPYIDKYLDHTFRVICDEHEGTYRYVLDLLADCVQRPGDPPGKALVLRGPQGRGKSVFVEAYGKLFGRHFFSANHRSQLTGGFNAHLSGRVLVVGDDAVWGGNKEDVGVLKFLITQRHLPITRKHIDTVSEPNYVHLILITNERWAWPAGNNERRGVILNVTAQRPRDYFNALMAEIQAPQFLPALLAFLQRHPVDRNALVNGIRNEALREQQEMTADPIQQWWHMVLEDGFWKGEPWPEWIGTESLYDQFTIDMGTQRGAGFSHRGTRQQFTRRILDMLPRSTRISTRQVRENLMEGVRGAAPEWVEKIRKVLVLPPLAVARASYDKFSGSEGAWPPVEETAEQLALEEM